MNESPVSRWEDKWKQRHTPWDLGGPHPGLHRLWQRLSPLSRQGTWWVPGCGRGHEAGFLVRKGLKAVGEDFSPTAIEVAQSTYGHLATFKVGDVLELREENTYDGVLDRAMWCALKPELWKDYLNACHFRLKPGGMFVSLAFGQLADIEEGPPFPVTDAQIRELLEGRFEIEVLESHPWKQDELNFLREEWWLVARAVK